MLTRIVKLTFRPEYIVQFENIFERTKSGILKFDGCYSVELFQDSKNPAVFFTYSVWENEHSLNAYRNSEFFKNVWGKTKLLFDEGPQAWSVYKKG